MMKEKKKSNKALKFVLFYLVFHVSVCYLLYKPLPDGFTRTRLDRAIMHVVEPALRVAYYYPSRMFSKPSDMVWWTRGALNQLSKALGPFFDMDDTLKEYTAIWNGVAVRVYAPKMNGNSTRGAVLFIHGGGFALGNVAMYDSICRRMARKTQAVFVSVEYRLSPETPFPGPILDCEAALDYLMENGRFELGIDTSKVVVMGDSAGGNLATVVAQRRTVRGEMPALRAQVLIYPLLQMADMQSLSYRYFNQRLLGYALVDPESVAYYYMFYAGIDMDQKGYLVPHVLSNGHVSPRIKSHVEAVIGNSTDDDFGMAYDGFPIPTRAQPYPSLEAQSLLDDFLTNPDFSPLMRSDLSGLPPTLVLTCEFDILRDEGIVYARRLQEAGVATTHVNYKNGFHAMLNFHSELAEATLAVEHITRWTSRIFQM